MTDGPSKLQLGMMSSVLKMLGIVPEDFTDMIAKGKMACEVFLATAKKQDDQNSKLDMQNRKLDMIMRHLGMDIPSENIPTNVRMLPNAQQIHKRHLDSDVG